MFTSYNVWIKVYLLQILVWRLCKLVLLIFFKSMVELYLVKEAKEKLLFFWEALVSVVDQVVKRSFLMS